MFPFLEVGHVLISSLPAAFMNPIFWGVIALIVLQYARMNRLEGKMLGRPKTTLFRRSLSSILYGIAGGFIGSYILIFIGVFVASSDILYLWPVAFLLMMVNPRFMCFSYAAGILGLSSLLFGVPQVPVPQIMALVAILHIVESLLIYLNGASGAVPVIMEGEGKMAQGGFLMQKFWPVPLALILIVITRTNLPGGTIWEPQWPHWWPLLKPELLIPAGYLVEYWLLPVPAGLGYSDIALRRSPEEKAAGSAMKLGIYSLTLLAIAVISDRVVPLQYVAVILSPLGHEAVIYLGRREEREGPPLFRAPEDGLMVLDVLPGSVGERMGLRPGDIIKKINDRPVVTIEELRRCNEVSPFYVEMEVEQIRKGGKETTLKTFQGNWMNLGVLILPRYVEGSYITLSRNGGFWQRFFKREARS